MLTGFWQEGCSMPSQLSYTIVGFCSGLSPGHLSVGGAGAGAEGQGQPPTMGTVSFISDP